MVLGASLSACGGGEVSSTPSPTPTPSPAPTPTPTKNVDLSGPLVSESFTNLSANEYAQLNGSTNATKPAVVERYLYDSDLKFSYDSLTNTYSLSDSAGSSTFSDSDKIDSNQYKKLLFRVTEYLTLARAGSNPNITYKYVGVGIWSQVRSDIGLNLYYNDRAFVYGVPTANLVRTGVATYATTAYGVLWSAGDRLTIGGSGTMTGNLATGQFQHTGNLTYADANGVLSGTGAFNSTMSLSSTLNQLTGSLTFSGPSAAYSGSVKGMFFGPNAEEVGAVFSATDPSGNIATGAFLGR